MTLVSRPKQLTYPQRRVNQWLVHMLARGDVPSQAEAHGTDQTH